MLLIQNNYNPQLTRVLIVISINKLIVSSAWQTNMSFNPFRMYYSRLQHYQGSVDVNNQNRMRYNKNVSRQRITHPIVFQ